MNKIQNLRNSSFNKQSGLCYYCRQPMWQNNLATFAQQNCLSENKARILKATAEHLKPRSEGGKNNKLNIVAACSFCNAHRHRSAKALSPEKYIHKVRIRLSKGKWHGISVAAFFLSNIN